MTTAKFAIAQALSVGWETFKEHAEFFVGAFILGNIISAVPSALAEFTAQEQPAVSMLFQIVSLIVGCIISLGWIRITLQALDKKPLAIGMLWGSTAAVGRYLAAGFLSTLAIVLGLVLLVVPGVIISIRLSLAGFYVLEKNEGAVQAMKSSWEATAGNAWNLFLFYVALVGLTIIACIPFFLGLLIALPVFGLAHAYVYRQLAHKSAPTTAPIRA